MLTTVAFIYGFPHVEFIKTSLKTGFGGGGHDRQAQETPGRSFLVAPVTRYQVNDWLQLCRHRGIITNLRLGAKKE